MWPRGSSGIHGGGGGGGGGVIDHALLLNLSWLVSAHTGAAGSIAAFGAAGAAAVLTGAVAGDLVRFNGATWAVVTTGQLGLTGVAMDVRGLRETGGPTLLTMGAVADLQLLARSGATIIGVAPALTGGLTLPYRTIAFADSPYTPLATDFNILVNAVGGAVIVDLPAAATRDNRLYNIKKIDASVNTMTIRPVLGETLDAFTNAAPATTAVQYTSRMIQSVGTGWVII